MDRRERITRFITPQQKGIEIGPYFAPLAPKREGYDCLAIDVFDRATLCCRAAEDPEIPDQLIDNIEEVDLLGSSSAIAELVATRHQLGTFDYIISSHNFEHLPDPVRFLQGCGKVLRPDGILSMAIPDRRTCFDYFRPHSTLADLLDGYFAARERPTLAQLFEQNSLHSRYGAQRAVGFSLTDDPAEITPAETLAEAFAEWSRLRARPDNDYRDAHCWTFTPASFELILRDLDFLQLTCWSVLEISESRGNEFYVHLRNSAAGATTNGSARDFYDQRRRLLHRVNDEASENCLRDQDKLGRIHEAERRAMELENAVERMRSSMSWRITAPLRRISGALRQAQRLAGPRFRSTIDQCDRQRIRGWIDDYGPLDAVSIEVNNNTIATVSPTMFRQDLLEAGVGDGRRAFSFDISGYLDQAVNRVTVKCADKVLITKEIIIPEHASPEDRLAVSQERWRQDEEPAGLTWGAMLTADSLWDLYCRYRQFSERDRILEIGPGYGRVLDTAIDRRIPFAEFVGIDLSETRVGKLRERFQLDTVRFAAGDATVWCDDRPFDVILSSATFEHLYPDCRNALTNLRAQLGAGGQLMIDFIKTDKPSAEFEPDTGAYVRAYTREELRGIFEDCGLTVDSLEPCSLGIGAHGKPIERFLVTARPPSPASAA
jgi:SAM-dependent methyltransferase